MLLRSDATGVRPVIQAELISSIAPVSSPSQDVFNRLMQVSIGKQFQAEVMMRQNDGTFLVRLADTTARMALPEGTQSGDTVSLTLVAANPRPTFLLGETTVSATPLPGQQAVAAGLLIDNMVQGEAQDGVSQIGKAAPTEATNATQQNQPASPANGSTLTSLSTTGRLIDSLLHATEHNNVPASINGQTAIVTSPDVLPSKLAQAMHETLEFSGLFYESHVGDWASGKRPTEALMREPQAQLGAEAANAKALATDASLTASIKSPEADHMLQLAMLNNDATHLIRMQLNALENRQFSWQGELWPGQQFEWEVSDETPQQQETAEAPSSWRSVMRFELPTLGTVHATLHLSGGHVQVQLRTATDDAAATIRPHVGKLASALDVAGSPLDLLTVRKDDAT